MSGLRRRRRGIYALAPVVVVALAGLTGLIGFAAWPMAVSAEGPVGVIAGRVVNGSAAGATPGGAPLLLRVYRDGVGQAERAALADAQGAFRFDGLAVGPAYTYRLTAAYGGIAYSTDPLRLMADAPEQQVELRVYEVSLADPGLGTARALFVVGGADAGRQEVAVTEIVTLTNPSDQTFAPRPDGPEGPMGLVRFSLPPGARDLRPVAGIDPTQILQVDRGVASLTPVPPGEHDHSFSYRLPYAGQAVTFERWFPYGAGRFFVLSPEGGPEVAGAGLSAMEPALFGATRYRVWMAQEIAPGTRLTIELRGLPP
ncbi:MAG: hypothetical protein ACRDJN_31590, partial [Chloroflexota bacterium]